MATSLRNILNRRKKYLKADKGITSPQLQERCPSQFEAKKWTLQSLMQLFYINLFQIKASQLLLSCVTEILSRCFHYQLAFHARKCQTSEAAIVYEFVIKKLEFWLVITNDESNMWNANYLAVVKRKCLCKTDDVFLFVKKRFRCFSLLFHNIWLHS